MPAVQVKILAIKSAQRYAVGRVVLAARQAVEKGSPGVEFKVSFLKERAEIERYTSVLARPSLVVNDTLVCVGRIPSAAEVTTWLANALALAPGPMGAA